MVLKPGYKQSDVGLIPDDWDVSTVSGEFSIQLGKMLDADRNVGVLKPYVGNRAVQWDRVDVSDLPTVPMTPSDLKRFRLEHGDILVCEGGEVGRAAIWHSPIEECYYQKALHRLRPLGGYSRRLMVAVLRRWSDIGFFRNYVTQTSIAHLPRDKFLTIPIPVPPPREQEAIATALSDVDALLERLDRLIAKKRDLKQAAMQQLLTGETRLPGYTGEWETVSLRAIADIHSGGTPSTSKRDFWDGGIPWCTPTDITALRGRKYLTTTERTISSAGLRSSSAELVPTHSVIMTSRATIGECAINTLPMSTNQGFKNLIPTDSDCEYLYYLMSTQKSRLIQLCGGSTFLEVGKRQLQQFEVTLPADIDEQKAIATILSDMDAEIEALEQRRGKTADLKQAMIQELLTGKTRLVEPQVSDEQAEAASSSAKGHNWAINEAVVIATLVKHFGKTDYPLGRKRYTKLAYLLHRRVEQQAEGYLKKAAGPYNPQTKYGGPEKIAKKNGYIKQHKGPKGHSGFIAADNIAQAEGYFDKWYGPEVIQWLEQFRYKKNDDLEVLATVDMAAVELRESGKSVDVVAVKDVIASHPEWEAKLDRAAFSDANIAAAIKQREALLGSGITGDSHA